MGERGHLLGPTTPSARPRARTPDGGAGRAAVKPPGRQWNDEGDGPGRHHALSVLRESAGLYPLIAIPTENAHGQDFFSDEGRGDVRRLLEATQGKGFTPEHLDGQVEDTRLRDFKAAGADCPTALGSRPRSRGDGRGLGPPRRGAGGAVKPSSGGRRTRSDESWASPRPRRRRSPAWGPHPAGLAAGRPAGGRSTDRAAAGR